MSKELKSAVDLDAEEQRLYDRLGPVFEQERRRMAQLLAGKEDEQLFGATEYEVRDAVHRLGAQALEQAAHVGRKKGAT